jgi:outer membrane lipoprotein LolB
VTRCRELLLVLLLSGCAAVPPHAPPQPCPGADCARSNINDWKLQGRISLTRGEQGWHAALDWENHADRYRLQVNGPLGQGALQLDGDARGVTLVDADGRIYTAVDAESLLLKVAGWRLPVAGLRFWVRGLPDPDAHLEVMLDGQGRVQQLKQSGWTIRYQRFMPVDGVEWPSRLTLEHDDLLLKMVIDRWQPGTVPAL